MFTVDEIFAARYPALSNNPILGPSLRRILKRLLHEKDFSTFSLEFPHLQGMDFVDQMLEYLGVSYTVSDRDRENIPTEGKVVIVANHPIGSLDGLALLKLIHEVRSDVHIVANDFLMFVKALQPCLLPVNNMTSKAAREQLKKIGTALQNEEAVVIFPAGEVSRLKFNGVRDRQWNKGFLSIAGRAKAPILPVHVRAKNSNRFYAISMLWKPLSTIMLIDEMFRKHDRRIRFTVGKIIPYSSYKQMPLRGLDKARLFKKHVYRIGKRKKPLFQTEAAIAHPERRHELKKELRRGQLLGKTPDRMQIYLYASTCSSPVIREIGRLREITFRAVEEGTGKRRDMDRYDTYYQHLLLWDEKELEIVGAYRLVDSAKVIEQYGKNGLYTDSLFSFDPGHHWFLGEGLELGRSFVQQRYWGKRSLDYLWYGIGAFIASNPQYRYLFGPVSISNTMPQTAKDLLIYFYTC